MLVLDVAPPDAGPPMTIIGQVAWSAPAPFGGSTTYAAGLAVFKAPEPEWTEMVQGSLVGAPDAEAEQATPNHPPERLGAFDRLAGRMGHAGLVTLYESGNIWYRGALISAGVDSIRIQTDAFVPEPGSAVQARIGVRDPRTGGPLAVRGRVPTLARVSVGYGGSIFDLELDHVSSAALFRRVVLFVSQGATW